VVHNVANLCPKGVPPLGRAGLIQRGFRSRVSGVGACDSGRTEASKKCNAFSRPRSGVNECLRGLRPFCWTENMAMEGVMRLHKSWYKIRRPLAVAAASLLWIAPLQVRAVAEDDMLQLAVNYVFTGRIDPPDRPEIVDRKSCV
jgi:hypothetical protein